MGTATIGAADLLALARRRVSASSVHADARKPFRFLLCGDPALVAELRALFLSSAPDANVPDDAPSTIETIDPVRRSTLVTPEARAVILLARPGDLADARMDLLEKLRLPIFALTVDPAAVPSAPAAAPARGTFGQYTVPRIDRESLRLKFFTHLVERCKGVEVAVGRRIPALRESVGIKLTRDAASSALKVAAASALADNVPMLGIILGAVASAGDIVAITGIQIVLMMQIGAAYGKDPDIARVWELLPVVGGGLGWRAVSRELSGFIPVAGIAIKGAIAYAGTIVVGEGVTVYYEYGKHMTPAQAQMIYEEKSRSALQFAGKMYTFLSKPKNDPPKTG